MNEKPQIKTGVLGEIYQELEREQAHAVKLQWIALNLHQNLRILADAALSNPQGAIVKSVMKNAVNLCEELGVDLEERVQ